jgi:membrane protein implicated in regulation of membrane protease activity
MLDLIFLIAAVGGGTIMLVQLALTLLGLDDGADGGDVGGHHFDAGDADTDGGFSDHGDMGIHLFDVLSFRTLVAAATFFGIGGKATLSSGKSDTIAIVVASIAGVVALYGAYWIMRQIYKLQSSGNEDIRNAIGRRAQVIVAIPAAKNGAGKVHVRMQNRLLDYRAITGDSEIIRSGTEVAVLDCLGSDTLEVTKVTVDAASENAEGLAKTV